MSITHYWVNPVTWVVAYQQIIGSLTRIAVYADFYEADYFCLSETQMGISMLSHFYIILR